MGRSSFTRKLTTSLLVGLLFTFLAVTAVRSRPSTDPDRDRAPATTGVLDRLELRLVDLVAAHQARKAVASPDIVLVSIDEESIARSREAVGGWPWPRAYLGGLAEELHALGARLVVFDSVFSEPAEPKQSGDDDRAFARSLDRAGPVVLGFRFAELSEQGALNPGRWAVLKGIFPERTEALAAAAPMLAAGASPYLVAASQRVELWLGGYRDRPAALKDAERRRDELQLPRDPVVRELGVEETLDRVSQEALFADRNAVTVPKAEGLSLKTFMTLQPPVPQLLASRATFGSVSSLSADDEGVVRGVRHLVKYEGVYYPSLALAAALRLADVREASLEAQRLRAGPFGAPVDPFGVSLLRFYGAAQQKEGVEAPYARIPAYAVLRSAARRGEGHGPDERLQARIRDRVVFVSNDAAASGERRSTPLFRAGARAVAFANALDNLIRGDGIQRASTERDSAVAALLALMGSLVSFLFTRSSRPLRTVLSQALASSVVLGAFLAYAEHRHRGGEWIGMAVPSLSFASALLLSTLINVWDEARTTGLVREALGSYTSPDLVDRILRNPQYFSMEGEQRVMTVYFADINDFSSLTEGLKPTDMVKLLNEYLSEVTDAVVDFGGQIDKFVADKAIAYWGAPLPNHEHAVEACRCAVRLRQRLAARAASWKSRFGVEIHARAGLNTGATVVGNMGARGTRRRVSYSVIGDAVSLASRLEAANKSYQTEILIGEATFEEARDAIEVREVDLMRVRGRRHPVRVFELLGMKGEIDEETRALAQGFEEALVAYRQRDFARALSLLDPLRVKCPSDALCALYLARCQAYLDAPPGDEWDGVWGEPTARSPAAAVLPSAP